MKKLKNLIAVVGFFSIHALSWAGSYDDFFQGIELDQPQTLRALLARGFDPNTANPEGIPALIRALQLQSFKAAQVLADDDRTRVELRTAHDESALMLAALRGQEGLVVQLVARGAQINKPGWTPLHYAATGAHVRVAAFLIGAHADVNAPSPNGTTPLMMAAMYGNRELVKLLLESGADVGLRNAQGLNASDFAERAGREDSRGLILQRSQR